MITIQKKLKLSRKAHLMKHMKTFYQTSHLMIADMHYIFMIMKQKEEKDLKLFFTIGGQRNPQEKAK